MPFEKEIQKYINKYCENHLADEEWFEKEFDFIKDKELKNRIIIEFKNARYIYKIFEGLNVKDELQLAEVRLQILMYASIYETILHYIIFDEYYINEECVRNMLIYESYKKYSITPEKYKKICKELKHDGKDIIPCFKAKNKKDITKIRFDEKCMIAKELGILHNIKDSGKNIDICAELISIYEIRNGIHIHAELKKEIDYQLSLSKLAYRRMKPFIEQIKEKLKKDKKI